jgi:hypothetical protein
MLLDGSTDLGKPEVVSDLMSPWRTQRHQHDYACQTCHQAKDCRYSAHPEL